MSDGNRLQRPPLERTGPRRSLEEQLFPRARDARAEPSEPAPAERGAGGAAQLGYQVIDEYLKQGQRAAERFGPAFPGAGMLGLFQAPTEIFLRDGLRWLEALGRFWGGAAGQRPEAGPAAAPASTNPVRVRIASRRPAEVFLQLQPSANGRRLGVHPLHSLEPNATALGDVAIELDEGGAGWRVAVRVPASQAPGRYSGVVYDLSDGAVRGTLEVRIDAEEPV